MKKLLAIGLAACLPMGLAAEDPDRNAELALGTMAVMVIDESTPVARDVVCARSASDSAAADCMAVHRALLTAHLKKVSTLRERGRWM
jgi:hypothetical protein